MCFFLLYGHENNPSVPASLKWGSNSLILVQIKGCTLQSGWISRDPHKAPTTEQEEGGIKLCSHLAVQTHFISSLSSCSAVQRHCVAVWACVCAVMEKTWRAEGRDGAQRQFVGAGGAVRSLWKTRGWVWWSYLLCADESKSLPAGCCSFSGQRRASVWWKGLWAHYSQTLPLWKVGLDVLLVVLFVSHFLGL